MVKIIVFSGSIRTGSLNQKLTDCVAQALIAKGVSVTRLSLRDYPLPVYDDDLEANRGIPKSALELKNLFSSNDGFIISSPEYNGFVPPILVNAFDWMTRGDDDAEPFKQKLAAIVAASPGGLGGIRMLPALRAFLNNLGVTVVASQMALSKAHEAFSANGDLVSEQSRAQVQEVINALLGLL